MFLYASRLQAHGIATASTDWRASLDYLRDFNTCICNLLVHVDLQHKTFSPRMPWSTHYQLPIFRGNGAGMLSDMPTFGLQLESFYSRNMWRPEIFIHFYWGLQSIDGYYYRSFTIACSMGTSDGDREKGGFMRPIHHGHSVWLTSDPNHSPFRVPSDLEFTNLRNSICIITLLRIKATHDLNGMNTAEQYALIVLLTSLESSLGVINACLPVSRPVFDKLKSSSLVSALSSWTSIKRDATSRDYEMHAKPKVTTWPVKNNSQREEKKTCQESITHLPSAVWSPPSSPHNGFE